ncbi:aminodeoxychorismate synthase, component I [Bacillus sp. AFS076308]|uniref:aminodeoxychorismate synthase component I n=1 Tax=unclassified Bacillus (in: firmicutes) TaxID=185979 RepID=UPI000BFA931D|nr:MULTISPECIES: aminodeoxychorismate synthase component I [unclassified Bacillus (in: firmicutes)]PFO01514.1 aminodeoxychorismate synthase, component I [Bacillus sp. AFS076308]PGV48242.1 aminodeoxychorismate synthase, component I [Bacillus sp. AFS037270]
METKNKEPWLVFEFANSEGDINPLIFKRPIKVIAAFTINEVLPCLKLVQEEVNNGYYAAGFLSYESAPAFDAAFITNKESKMPLLWFGIFAEPEYQSFSSTGSYALTKWEPSVSLEEYNQSIQAIKDGIERGDTYQTNYTIRLHSHFEGDDFAFFEKLKKAQSSDYCAYINTGEYSILSASPELFFRLQDETIITRPMKGTIKRGKSFEEDEANARWLYLSEKNRAENVMIVDMLRNDLSLVAEFGTVQVPKLYEIEPYPTVYQMTSTITGRVAENTELIDIFRALFPCASITGAPKVSTMKIIGELEPEPREVYCGAIGYITPNKEAVFNVPIRTVLIDQQSGLATYGVGGGITWDSTSEGEYDEVLAKASLLEEDRPEFELLESLLLEYGKYFLLKEHLERLKKSAQYFGFSVDIECIQTKLDEFSSRNSGKLKVRLLVNKKGVVTIDAQPVVAQPTPIKVILAGKPVDKDNTFLYHKTTNRSIYTDFQLTKPSDVFDTLLWNKDEELTEFTNGNLVLELDGKLWTPPVNSGLLAGTFREMLIKEGMIREKVLTIADLQQSSKVWFINSVRKWLEVELVE